MAETLALLEYFVQEGGPHQVVTLDASMCVTARTDDELRRIVLSAELVTPDSIGVLWGARRLGFRLPERVSGVEMAGRLAHLSAMHGWGIYLLGAAPGVAEEAATRMAERWPGCRIVGCHHGYFSPEDEEPLAARIGEAAPEVLLVAMGIPRQEKWIARWRDVVRVPVMMGVGGTLDVFSGRIPRAPEWMQKRGLEWVYRVCRDPRKLRKVLMLPRFVWMVEQERRRRRHPTAPSTLP